MLRSHPGHRIVQCHPGAGDGGRARTAIGLQHVAVNDDLLLGKRREIGDRAQRTANQPLDLLRAAGLLADGCLASHAVIGGARQHAIFSRHPATARALEPRRHLFGDRGRAQHMGLAEADKAGALGLARHGAFEGDGTKRVWGAF